MKGYLQRWRERDYEFTLDWLLRSVNTVLTGEARFHHLHDRTREEVESALRRAGHHIDTLLNLIADRLGLDHDRVLFARSAFAVMARLMELRGGKLDHIEAGRLLFWYVQNGMWGRYSGTVETMIDHDLEVIEQDVDRASERLLEDLRLWRQGFVVEPEHFTGWSIGARFYPVLYMMTRMGGARDWGGAAVQLSRHLLGKHSTLHVHHIFPKSRLYEEDYHRSEVNALANYAFLTAETNQALSNRLPEEYFPEVEEQHPGALASQWIPMDEALWKIERYPDFLEARRELLAAAANRYLASLLGDEAPRWLEERPREPIQPVLEVPGGPADEEEEALLERINDWIEEQGFARGELCFELVEPETGRPIAILDLAWPEGLQQGLTEPVALLIGEPKDVLARANAAGFRCFTTEEAFRAYALRRAGGAIPDAAE